MSAVETLASMRGAKVLAEAITNTGTHIVVCLRDNEYVVWYVDKDGAGFNTGFYTPDFNVAIGNFAGRVINRTHDPKGELK